MVVALTIVPALGRQHEFALSGHHDLDILEILKSFSDSIAGTVHHLFPGEYLMQCRNHTVTVTERAISMRQPGSEIHHSLAARGSTVAIDQIRRGQQ